MSPGKSFECPGGAYAGNEDQTVENATVVAVKCGVCTEVQRRLALPIPFLFPTTPATNANAPPMFLGVSCRWWQRAHH